MAITTSLTTIVIVAIFGLGLLIWLFRRNQKDKKDFFSPENTSDKTEELRLENDQKRDKL